MPHRPLFFVLATGCLSTDSRISSAAGDAIFRTAAEPPGANCPEGGTRLDIGTDADGDGRLDDGEVTDTLYVCDGADGGGGGGGGWEAPQAVVAGDRAICGLRADGQVVCWHELGNSAPPPEGSFTAIEVLNGHDVCALDAAGELTCWSRRLNPSWQWDWELPVGPFVSWSGHCGLREDGSVACLDGKSLPGTYVELASNTCTSFTSESGQCEWFACGLAADGAVTCASLDSGLAWDAPDGVFQTIDLGIARGPAAYEPAACGIREDDSLACWGRTLVPSLPSGRFRAVSVGDSHACAIRVDGTMACWGFNNQPNEVAADGTFAQVSAGLSLTCAQRTSGEVECWGICREYLCEPPSELYLGP